MFLMCGLGKDKRLNRGWGSSKCEAGERSFIPDGPSGNDPLIECNALIKLCLQVYLFT